MGISKVALVGHGLGALVAGAFAMRSPESVDRLVLTAFTYKGTGAAEIGRRQKRIEELRANPRRKRDAAMIRSIFTRDGHASDNALGFTYTESTGRSPAVVESRAWSWNARLNYAVTFPTDAYITPFKNLFLAMSLVPLIIPGIVHTIAWILLLSPRIGMINTLLARVSSLIRRVSIYSAWAG